MASEDVGHLEHAAAEENPQAEEQASVAQARKVAWYARLSEDWWATIVGLLLIVLIVTRLISTIP